MLIGAYFSEEYSFEAAALFNPSIVPHPDQTGVVEGEIRVLLSLRGIGEGNISSVTFRTGSWSQNSKLTIETPCIQAISPRIKLNPVASRMTPGSGCSARMHAICPRS